MYKDRYNRVCYLSEKTICYSAKRVAEWYFDIYDKSDLKNPSHVSFHPIGLHEGCKHFGLNEEQEQQLKTILKENGFPEGL
jgi:hypothetical protein